MWQGEYFDGQSAKSTEVTIELTSECLCLTVSNQEKKYWKYPEFRVVSDPFLEVVYLETKERFPQKLMISDPAFFEALEVKSKAHRQQKILLSEPKTWLWMLALLGGSFLIVIGFYFWGSPMMAKGLSKVFPHRWEDKLGDSIYSQLFSGHSPCHSSAGKAALEKLLLPLDTPKTTVDSLTIHIIHSEGMNAYALPGGQVLISSELLDFVESPEELAGILAHEIQHIEQRHGIQQLIRGLLSGGMIAVVSGGFSGIEAFLTVTEAMALLNYSREAEIEADQLAAEQLRQAGISLNGLRDFHERVSQHPSLAKQWIPQYLSTHPASEERIELLDSSFSTSPTQTSPLLTEDEWKHLKQMCRPPLLPPSTIKPL